MAKPRPAKPRRSEPDWRYWDSTVFLAWLLREPARVQDVRAVLDAADKGKVRIVTSTITLTEVIKLKGQMPVGKPGS